jgi:hypothetical protein
MPTLDPLYDFLKKILISRGIIWAIIFLK